MRASRFSLELKSGSDQILLDSDVPGQHMRDEAVGESMFNVQHANHLVFFNE